MAPLAVRQWGSIQNNEIPGSTVPAGKSVKLWSQQDFASSLASTERRINLKSYRESGGKGLLKC